jgi:hypothetical protein
MRLSGYPRERKTRSFECQEAHMKSHMDGEVKWVWIVTSLAIVFIVTLLANAAGS